MPRFLDTRGHTPLSVALCARCGLKYPRDELRYDVNYPGLLCCPYDLDDLDPYRLPPRITERVDFDGPRPDVNISSPGPSPNLIATPIFGIEQVGYRTTWQPNTPYNVGDSITPQDINSPYVDLPQSWFLCLVGGVSGATAPNWPPKAGQILGDFVYLTSDVPVILLTSDGPVFIQLVADGNGDGTVVWLNLGVYPN